MTILLQTNTPGVCQNTAGLEAELSFEDRSWSNGWREVPKCGEFDGYRDAAQVVTEHLLDTNESQDQETKLDQSQLKSCTVRWF